MSYNVKRDYSNKYTDKFQKFKTFFINKKNITAFLFYSDIYSIFEIIINI